MVAERTRIENLAAAEAVFEQATTAAPTLVVPVEHALPAWLDALVDRAHAAGTTVAIGAEPPSDWSDDRRAGWEIGVCTAALHAGVDEIVGIAPQRVNRVRAVVAAIDAAARPADHQEPVS